MTAIITIDKSLLMRVAWTRAYEAALAAGNSVRQHLSTAMRSAWSDWRECVAEGEIRCTLTKEYDDRYRRMDRAMMRRRIAAAAETIAAMNPQQVQQQQACAPAPVQYPTGLPTDGWLDEQIGAFIEDVIGSLIEPANADPVFPMSEVTAAEFTAFRATKRWVGMFEQDRDDPMSVPFGDLFDARQAMQDAHAKLDALTAAVA